MSPCTHRHHYRNTILGLAALVAVALLTAPAAMACNKKGKGKDCPPPNPNPPTSGFAHLEISDNTTADPLNVPDVAAGPVSCEMATASVTSSGDYNCESDAVWFRTVQMTNTYNKKHRVICNSLSNPDDPLVTDAEGLSYGWTDDCTDGSCAVEVRMTFSGAQVSNATGGKSDMLDLVFYGQLNGTSGTESNPFKEAQTFDVDSIDMYFFKPGSTRLAGSCTLYADGVQVTSTPYTP